jgi:hypothetical protein
MHPAQCKTVGSSKCPGTQHPASLLLLLLPPDQGYRTVSDKVWTIGQTSREGDLIATIIDPDPDTDYGLSSDDDDEGGSGGDMRGGEVVPLLAVYEVLMAAGFDPEAAHAANMM